MKKRDLLDTVSEMSDDADLVIGNPLVIDEEEKFTAVIDLPIVGIATNKDDNEIRFLLRLEDVKQVFHPDEVMFIEE